MRPAECLAVVLNEDGTGKVILSGSRAACDIAARAENEKIGRQSGCVAVYSKLLFTDCGSLGDMKEILEARRGARAATPEAQSSRLTGLQSRRAQIRTDQVANERAISPNAAKAKALAADLEAVNAEIAKATPSGKKTAQAAEKPAAVKGKRKSAGNKNR